jgi:uncharacterized membrane protein SpoIIM required for sporulation
MTASTFRLIVGYENLAARLYQARSGLPPGDPLRRRLEEAAAEASQDLLSFQRERQVEDEHSYSAWVARYRAVWRENGALFLFTLALFLVSAVTAWAVTVHDPDIATAILSQTMVEDVLEQKKWFESIQPSPLWDGIQIAINNIKVAINCFILGSMLGIGGLLLLSYNAVILGGILAFCYINGFDEELMRFITGHGVLEMTIMIASAFASFLFGRVFYMRPYSLFRQRMALAASDAGVVLVGILPWLLLAATIEVGVSPWPQYSTSSRVLIGVGVAAPFWIWTLWPKSEVTFSSSRKSARRH